MSAFVQPYARLAPHYDRVAGYSQFASVRRAFEHVVSKHSLRFDTAADFGCGTGLFLRHLISRGARVAYGVDTSPAMLDVARHRLKLQNVALVHCDFAGIRLPRPVELITMLGFTLNLCGSLRRLRQVVGSVWRNLTPGGCWLLDFLTPLRDRARTLRLRFRFPLEDVVEHHKAHLFPPPVLASELSRAGFILLDAFDYLNLAEPSWHSPALVFLLEKRGDRSCTSLHRPMP